MNQLTELQQYVKAGYPGIYIVSHEEQRVFCDIHRDIQDIKYDVCSWSCTTGIVFKNGTKEDDTEDIITALGKFANMSEKTVLVLRDFDLELANATPILVRTIKDLLAVGKNQNKHLVIIACEFTLPVQLQKEFVRIDFKLPTKEELLAIADNIAQCAGRPINGKRDAIAAAASGLTSIEAENAFAKSVIVSGEIAPETVAKEKSLAIKKGEVLEIIEKLVEFDDIGGMACVKDWVRKRKRAFTKEAAAYGLPTPKGILLFGVQGAGKSYLSKAIAKQLDVPMLKLDAGRLFGSLVGQSEATTRQVIKQVEAFGSCVLMIDELDKSFAGMKDGGGDSGTTRRVIGTFLTWMQEKTSPVFVVATANDLTKLPPELLRKGRWDELWFVDLPTQTERVEIWRVQIRLHGRNPDDFDLNVLSQATNGWTGAEIEALFNEGLYTAFDQGREPDTEMLVSLSRDTQPLSKTMASDIEALRVWAKGRARTVSEPERIELKSGRKVDVA